MRIKNSEEFLTALGNHAKVGRVRCDNLKRMMLEIVEWAKTNNPNKTQLIAIKDLNLGVRLYQVQGLYPTEELLNTAHDAYNMTVKNIKWSD